MARNKETITVTIDNKISEKLEKYHKDTMVSRSALINKLLKEFFEKIK